MLALYNVGPAVEGTLGGNRFLALYLGSAVGGNLLGYMLGSGFSSSMGSSGAAQHGHNSLI
jgi:membrane associated rhomboid family serine protease